MTTHLDSYILEGTPLAIRKRYASLCEFAQENDLGTYDEEIIVLDTETTGVSFSHDHLTQIAAARMRRGEIIEWFVTFVNPGKHISEDIEHLTHISDDDVADAPTPNEALDKLVEFVGCAPIVAHNEQFDRTFCTKYEAGLPLRQNIWIDSLDLARIVVPRLRSHRLLDLARAFDTHISTHRADADVEALCDVYRILLAGIWAMPLELVTYIGSICPDEEWMTHKVFEDIAVRRARVSRETVPTLNLKMLRDSQVKTQTRKPKHDAFELIEDGKLLKFATDRDITEAFSAEGLVGQLYAYFEPRAEQIEMSKRVNKAFSHSEHLVVEAGTGVGKSMAYLIPAAYTALNNEIGVGIATKTNALLDQLVNHELPLLRRMFPELTFTSLKGFNHYLCMRKVEQLTKSGSGSRVVQGTTLYQAPALAACVSFIEQAPESDIDDVKLDFRALPKYEITTTSHECLRRKCPYFGSKCYVHNARERARQSDIVVTNHTLLYCDVAADNALLPPLRYWVIDEAHSAETEARKAMSLNVDMRELARYARVLTDESGRNLFNRIEQILLGQVEAEDSHIAQVLNDEERTEAHERGLDGGDTLVYALCARAQKVAREYRSAVQTFTDAVHGLLYFDPTSKNKGYDRFELWINDEVRASEHFGEAVATGQRVVDTARNVVLRAQPVVSLCEDVTAAATAQRELSALIMNLNEAISALELILIHPSEEYVYSAALSKRGQVSDVISAQLIEMGDTLREAFYENTCSVVHCSATIAVGDSFESFKRGLGLQNLEHERVSQLKLASSYNYEHNMCVFVINNLPDPNDSSYVDKLQEALVELHRAQQGSTLTLFTNRKEMERCYAFVQPALTQDDLRVVCQKWGVSIKGLRDDFIADEHLSLFALKSFWEGFDAPGATLKSVIIPRLPFSKPTDPLSREREKLNPRNAWAWYSLPQAVIEVKQAAGRLIRSSHDSGVLILADTRLLTKGYGKTFLRSLPNPQFTAASYQEIADEIRSMNK